MNRKKRHPQYQTYGGIIGVIVFFVIMLSIIVSGVDHASASIQSHGQRAAEEAIRQAAISCYALEGSYPESYEYLKNHYGLEVNEELYVIEYHIFASNIMPDITVIKR